MKNTIYSILSPTGIPLGILTKDRFKRVISEEYRDDFRYSVKNNIEKTFLKKYAKHGWTSSHYNEIQLALKGTKNPHIDHLIPLDFWISYKEGTYLSMCIAPENIHITTKRHNLEKGCNLPCLDNNNQKLIILSSKIKTDINDFKYSLMLYDSEHPDFYKNINEENIIKNICQPTKNGFEDFI
jgi:hypothetical protein